ncbi:hypothetical protein NPIL_602181 [Nephila pilipes]|uniref:Uncharacterized protein n=1 Tax=Nephila pilipes TaxID=299642 RepID=A0A8X6NI97_NEPPI|nr:hypothetical protein NPIL_602181 [Nephila pilipes]
MRRYQLNPFGDDGVVFVERQHIFVLNGHVLKAFGKGIQANLVQESNNVHESKVNFTVSSNKSGQSYEDAKEVGIIRCLQVKKHEACIKWKVKKSAPLSSAFRRWSLTKSNLEVVPYHPYSEDGLRIFRGQSSSAVLARSIGLQASSPSHTSFLPFLSEHLGRFSRSVFMSGISACRKESVVTSIR